MSDLLACFNEESSEENIAQPPHSGEVIIDRPAIDKTISPGRGLVTTTLRQIHPFYFMWSFEQIRQTLSDEFPDAVISTLPGIPALVNTFPCPVSRQRSLLNRLFVRASFRKTEND